MKANHRDRSNRPFVVSGVCGRRGHAASDRSCGPTSIAASASHARSIPLVMGRAARCGIAACGLPCPAARGRSCSLPSCGLFAAGSISRAALRSRAVSRSAAWPSVVFASFARRCGGDIAHGWNAPRHKPQQKRRHGSQNRPHNGVGGKNGAESHHGERNAQNV